MTKFLFTILIKGGTDHFDQVIPYDEPTYNALFRHRGPLYRLYDEAGYPRDRVALEATVLHPRNEGADALEPGRQFAFSPQMPNMAKLFNEGLLSIVSDVGPLLGPTTKQDFLNGIGRPPALLSHNDQQQVAETGGVEGRSATGFFGRLNDLLNARFELHPDHKLFDRIALGSSDLLKGDGSNPFQINASGAVKELAELANRGPARINTKRGPEEYKRFTEMLRGDVPLPANLLKRFVIRARQQFYTLGKRFGRWMSEPVDAIEDAPLTADEAGRTFSEAYQTILRILDRADSDTPVPGGLNHLFVHLPEGVSRADTHGDQHIHTPVGQRHVDAFIGALTTAVAKRNMQEDVAMLIMSEFGRSITTNPTGTDHAWAGYHYWIGGPQTMAASGGRFVGGTPASPDFNPENPNDLAVPRIINKRGHVIPQNALEQSLANAGSFLGLTHDVIVNGYEDIPGAMPNLAAFGETPADAVLPILPDNWE